MRAMQIPHALITSFSTGLHDCSYAVVHLTAIRSTRPATLGRPGERLHLHHAEVYCDQFLNVSFVSPSGH